MFAMYVNSIRAHTRSESARGGAGDAGFVLLFTIAVMILLSFGALALLELTQVEAKVSINLPAATKKVRESDGALETALNDVRTDPNAEVNNAGVISLNDTSYTCPYAFNGDIGTTPVVGNAAFPDVKSVECQSNATSICSTVPAPCNKRDLILTTYTTASPTASTKPFGQARVVITDSATLSGATGATISPGATLTVCDWQVGSTISSKVNSCK